MRNFWLVSRHEYRKMVVRRSFILLTLAIPVALIGLMTVAILFEIMQGNDLPVGYVDHSGLLDVQVQHTLPDAKDAKEIRAYADETAGLEALEAEAIQALFVMPADYPQDTAANIYYQESPPEPRVWRDFNDFVRANLVVGLSPETQLRLLERPQMTVHDINSGRTFGEDDVINIIVPLMASFIFLFATMSASGSLLAVVADEKENRTMEVMLTSVTPGQMLSGKAVGLLAGALTQLLIYLVIGVVVIKIASAYIPELEALKVPIPYLLLVASFFLPAFALLAGVMVAIGGAVTERQQGQQISGMLNLVFLFPLFTLPLLFTYPNNAFVTFLTLFPPTSFLTVMLRWGLGSIPNWQVILSWVLLVSSAIFMMWAAVRIFRAGMLQYGRPLKLKSAVAAIRGR
jgi:ABC-2 type transport system permease protein